MPNPRITIETLLERIKPSDIKNVEKQLKSIAANADKAFKDRRKVALSLPVGDLRKYSDSLGKLNTQTVVWAAKTKIATGRLGSFKEAMQAGSIVMANMMTLTGFMNNLLNIFISRFGTMIALFFVFTKVKQAIKLITTAWSEMDTAVRKVASLVVSSSGDMGRSIRILTRQMIDFGLEIGVSFQQMSDTMFFLASAGLESAEIFQVFAAAQKLVIATAKDMVATLDENKKAVEILAGLLNLYGDTLTQFTTAQEKAIYISGILFASFRTQQILLSELAVGLSFASSQTRIAGISIEELIASVAVLNTAMLKGSKAGTSYANAIRDAAKKSVQLKELFDIDLTGLGTQFSLIESVVRPLSKQIEKTGFGTKQLINLFKVFGLRGARAIALLTTQLARYDKLRKDMETGTSQLNDAVNIVSESYKFQQQELQNIKTTIGAVFGIALTGGQGLSRLLKSWNDLLKGGLKNFISYAAVIGSIVFVLVVVIRLMRLWKKEMDLLRDKFAPIRKEFFNLVKEVSKGPVVAGGAGLQIKQFIDAYAKQLDVLGESGKEAEAIWENVKWEITKDARNIEILLKEAFGTGADSVEEVMKRLGISSSQMSDIIDNQIKSIEDMDKAYEAFGSRLSKTVVLFDRLSGKTIDFDLIPTFAFKEIEVELDKMKKAWWEAVFEIKALDDSKLPIFRQIDKFDEFGALDKVTKDLVDDQRKILDSLTASFDADPAGALLRLTEKVGVLTEQTLDKQLIALSKQMFAERMLLRNEADKTIQEVTTRKGNVLAIVQAFGQKELELLAKFANQARTLRLNVVKEELNSLTAVSNEALIKFRSFLTNIGKEIAGVRQDLLKPADVLALTIEDIIPKQTDLGKVLNLDALLVQFTGLEEGIDEALIKTYNKGFKIINKAWKDFGTERLNLTIKQEAKLRDSLLQNLQPTKEKMRNAYRSMQEDVLTELKIMVRGVTNLTKEQRKVIETAVTDIASLGPEGFKSLRAFITDPESKILLERAIKDITGLTKLELDKLAEAVAMSEKLRDTEIANGIRKIRELQAQLLKLEGTVDQVELDKLWGMLNELIEDFRDKADDADLKVKQFSATLRAWGLIVRESGGIMTDLTELIGNEFSDGVVKTIEVINVLTVGTDRLLQSIEALKTALATSETAGSKFANVLQTIGGSLGVIGAAISIVTTLSSLLRKNKEEQSALLSEEFLPDDATRRIAPDFGQARVINQRISLNPLFQFLDASQLSPARQRQLAEIIVDEITELQRAEG